MKKVAIVIINYNSAAFTTACVQSIREQTAPGLDYEIIIVDNNSEPADYEEMLHQCAQLECVKIVRSRLNTGFSGGNMLGAQYADAEYIFFLNNDTVLLNDCPSILYRFMETHPGAGLCTGQMYNSDGSFHHSFGYFPSLWLKIAGPTALRFFHPKAYPDKKKVYTEPLPVSLVTGAAMFVRSAAFDRIGGFDTCHFLYCEEEDVALRLKKAGYSTWLVPEGRFIHHAGKSTTQSYDIKKEYYVSLLYYHRKHASRLEYVLLKGVYFFKNFKKCWKHRDYLKLAFFVLVGAGLEHSLRHQQQMRQH